MKLCDSLARAVDHPGCNPCRRNRGRSTRALIHDGLSINRIDLAASSAIEIHLGAIGRELFEKTW